jgi:hypothetical protein
MATSTPTQPKATQPKATTAGPYRANPAWHAAHQAAVGAHRGNATARAALVVATHLAWRAPGASVAWHKGTNAAMLATASTLGVTTGQPVHVAMAKVVASLPGSPTATALAKATAALAPAGK